MIPPHACLTEYVNITSMPAAARSRLCSKVSAWAGAFA